MFYKSCMDDDLEDSPFVIIAALIGICLSENGIHTIITQNLLTYTQLVLIWILGFIVTFIFTASWKVTPDVRNFLVISSFLWPVFWFTFILLDGLKLFFISIWKVVKLFSTIASYISIIFSGLHEHLGRKLTVSFKSLFARKSKTLAEQPLSDQDPYRTQASCPNCDKPL